MVVWSKIIPLVAVGAGLLFLVNAFTRPAHASQTAGAIQESISSLGTAGASIQTLGRGIGGGIAGLFQPLWEISNLFERFSTLASGGANVSPVAQGVSSPSSPTYIYTGSSSPGSAAGSYSASPSDTGGGTLTSGQFGGTDTSYGWGI
jgi:hypothetical protein